MNVWVRVAGSMQIKSDVDPETASHVEIDVGINLTLYATKEQAQKAQDKAGGIILEVNSSCLGAIKSEFGTDVLLADANDIEGSQSSGAYISVCHEGLASKVDPQSMVAEFGPEATAWLDMLENETGWKFFQ